MKKNNMQSELDTILKMNESDISEQIFIQKEMLIKRLDEQQETINERINELEDYKAYLVNDDRLKNTFKRIVDTIDKEILKEKSELEKYSALTPDDIQVIISGTNLEKENIPEWIEQESFFKNFTDEMKAQIQDFVEKLWDAGKLYQPRRDNKLSKEAYIPVSGVFTKQEFETVLENMLTNTQTALKNLEMLRQVFPEQFPTNLSIREVCERYNISEYDIERFEDELDEYEEYYEKAYEKEQSIEDEILSGNQQVSFTTPASDDKIK